MHGSTPIHVEVDHSLFVLNLRLSETSLDIEASRCLVKEIRRLSLPHL